MGSSPDLARIFRQLTVEGGDRPARTSFGLLAVLNVGFKNVGARHAVPEVAERRAGSGFKSGKPRTAGMIAGRYLKPGPPRVAVTAWCSAYPVPNRRDAQRTLAASGLGNPHPSHRLGPVGLRAQLFLQASQPLPATLGLDLLKRHAVHSRRPAVGLRQPDPISEAVRTAPVKSILVARIRTLPWPAA